MLLAGFALNLRATEVVHLDDYGYPKPAYKQKYRSRNGQSPSSIRANVLDPATNCHYA